MKKNLILIEQALDQPCLKKGLRKWYAADKKIYSSPNISDIDFTEIFVWLENQISRLSLPNG